jgi:RNA polymerase sigma-70 factor (ECF subfamily)
MAQVDRFGGEFDGVLAAAQAGAPWALERIFTTLSPVVAGYLRLQGSHEPDDLTSEVFVAVLRRIGSFRGDEAGFRSWVFTIAHRRLIDERRRLVRQAVVGPMPAGYDAPAPDDVVADALRSLAQERVRELCDRLVPDQRDVLLLRLLGAMTIEEVAKVMGRSVGAVKALQRRGFRAVGRILEQEGVPL